MIKTLTAIVAASAVAMTVTKKKAYAWKSSTHQDIARKGIALLKKDGYDSAYALFSRYEDEILLYTQKPDFKGDIDKGKGWHYYCVTDVHGNEYKKSQSGYRRSGKNIFSPSRFCRTARTIFEDNYQTALSFYQAGEIEKSMQFVARCVHMVADIGCTPHTTNLTLTSVKNSKHKRYEFFTTSVFEKFEADSGDEKIYNMFMHDELFGECLNTLSKSSAENYDIVVYAKKESELEEIVGKSLCLVQQYVAAFLLRFCTDAEKGSASVETGEKYYIKNADSGKYLSVLRSKNGDACLCVLSDSRCVSQSGKNCTMFRARLCDDGAFIFAVSEGNQLAAEPYKICDKADFPFGYKVGKTPNGIRLSAKSCSYNYVLSPKNEKRLCNKLYNPDDMSQHWIFEKA